MTNNITRVLLVVIWHFSMLARQSDLKASKVCGAFEYVSVSHNRGRDFFL